MNKTLKIILICFAAVAALVAVGHGIVNRMAEKQIREALANVPGVRIGFKDLDFSLMAGNVGLNDVEVELTDSTGKSPDIQASIDAIKLEGVRWRRLLKGEARAKRLVIRKPEAKVTLPKKAKAQKKKETKAVEEASAGQASFLKAISLSELRVEKGKIGLESRGNAMKASLKELGVSVRDIGVQLEDSTWEFNDSSYSFKLDSLDYIDETGLNRIKIARLSTADAGPVEAQGMHFYNCVPMEKMAERLGKVAAMWYDAQLDSLQTDSLNIPRLMSSQRIEIGRVHLSGPKAVVFQDDRYPPAVPYPTIQEGLNNMGMPLKIKQIDAHLKTFTFIWQTTDANRGTFPMENVRVTASSIGNAPGNVMKMDVKTGKKGSSHINMAISVRNNKQEETRGTFLVEDWDASTLEPFVKPLFGVTLQANIHKIDSRFKGDKHQMTSDFCMTYDNLAAKAWKDESAPIKLVSQNSGLITFLAKVILPKSNPTHPGKEPKKVEFTFKRDPMQPYPAYLIQNLTNGMLKTVLPGSVEKASANKKSADQKPADKKTSKKK